MSLRRSERVTFEGGTGFQLGGIIDAPIDLPRATVLFTHCFTCTKDLKAIVRISRGLAEAGFAVLRYDLTGLGNSQGDFSQTNFSTNQADLLNASQFLSRTIAPPRFLVGHSFGALCSLSVTEQLPSVHGTVSISGPSDTQHLADLLERMDPEIRTQGVGQVSIGGREYNIRQQMMENFRAQDLPATLRGITKPTLLFHSPVDETLGYEHVLRLFSLLTQRAGNDPEPSPASLITLPGADHLLIRNQADSALVIEATAAWFHRFLVD